MSRGGEADEDGGVKRRVAYVFSSEFIQKCDSLSKVPNRVSELERLK